MTKKIVVFLYFCCLFATSRVVSAEHVRERITVSAEQNRTLILVRVYRNNHIYLSYGYFTENSRHNNGVSSATVLILEEARDIFMQFDENSSLTSFSTINYDRNEEFEIYFCGESDDSNRRCAEMQEFWNEMYMRYEIKRRVVRALGR